MKSPIPDYLDDVLAAVRSIEDGAPADYIEVLARADTSRLAVALATVDGKVYAAGDADVEFSIQSISKAFVYGIAIEDAGLDGVLARVGVEPSGDRFNELSLERGSNRPMNPMINAGAIATHSLVVSPTASREQRDARVLDVLSRLAGRPLSVDEEVYEAELRDADRNRGLGYMLKAAGIIDGDPEAIVSGYIRQCSINVTVRDLAMMAATLANAGVQPATDERILPTESVRQLLSVMTTCGMYDAAGDWVSTVGIPAKSGVAGGIIGALPGQLGIAVFSPNLDQHGNSVRGVAVCERLSRDMGLHMMDVSQIGRALVRTQMITLGGGRGQETDLNVPVYELRGAIRFGGAELLTRTVSDDLADTGADGRAGRYADTATVIFSLRHTHSLNNVAQRMLREIIRRLRHDGREVVVIDPASVLDLGDLTDDELPHRVETDEAARAHVGGSGCRIVASSDDS